MKPKLRKSFLWATLAGALVVGVGAVRLSAQNPNEPIPGTRADQGEDRQEIRQLRANTRADEQRLRSDVIQFGKRSPQARADRRQVRQDREQMRRLQRDRQRDRRIR